MVDSLCVSVIHSFPATRPVRPTRPRPPALARSRRRRGSTAGWPTPPPPWHQRRRIELLQLAPGQIDQWHQAGKVERRLALRGCRRRACAAAIQGNPVDGAEQCIERRQQSRQQCADRFARLACLDRRFHCSHLQGQFRRADRPAQTLQGMRQATGRVPLSAHQCRVDLGQCIGLVAAKFFQQGDVTGDVSADAAFDWKAT